MYNNICLFVSIIILALVSYLFVKYITHMHQNKENFGDNSVFQCGFYEFGSPIPGSPPQIVSNTEGHWNTTQSPLEHGNCNCIGDTGTARGGTKCQSKYMYQSPVNGSPVSRICYDKLPIEDEWDDCESKIKDGYFNNNAQEDVDNWFCGDGDECRNSLLIPKGKNFCEVYGDKCLKSCSADINKTCTTDKDCVYGSNCDNNGKCHFNDCVKSEDCEGIDNNCFSGKCAPKKCTPDKNDDCESKICTSGKCAPKTCTTDKDCDNNNGKYYCSSPSPGNCELNPCSKDTDCPASKYCDYEGACKFKQCTKDTDCAYNSNCVNNTCRPFIDNIHDYVPENTFYNINQLTKDDNKTGWECSGCESLLSCDTHNGNYCKPVDLDINKKGKFPYQKCGQDSECKPDDPKLYCISGHCINPYDYQQFECNCDPGLTAVANAGGGIGYAGKSCKTPVVVAPSGKQPTPKQVVWTRSVYDSTEGKLINHKKGMLAAWLAKNAVKNCSDGAKVTDMYATNCGLCELDEHDDMKAKYPTTRITDFDSSGNASADNFLYKVFGKSIPENDDFCDGSGDAKLSFGCTFDDDQIMGKDIKNYPIQKDAKICFYDNFWGTHYVFAMKADENCDDINSDDSVRGDRLCHISDNCCQGEQFGCMDSIVECSNRNRMACRFKPKFAKCGPV
jgi:hypothetical protein